MSKASHHTGWPVLAGIVLVVLGVWLLLNTFLGPLLYPIEWLLELLARVGWPLLLIGIGILLIIRARGGGFNVTGKRLYRSRTNRMIGGVLGGMSAYLNVDVTVLRVIFAILTLVTGVWWGVLLYIAAMIVVPEEQLGASWSGAPWTAEPPAANAPAPPPPAPPVPPAPGSAPPPPPAPPSDSRSSREAPPVPKPPSAPDAS
jgi:phage shock protein C